LRQQREGRRQTDLYDRQEELWLVETCLDEAAQGSGGALLVQGPPGIGKTSLLRAARRLAKDGGLECVAARAGELEVEFPFGVASQLFERRVALAGEEERRELLGGPAEVARAVLDPDGSGEPPKIDVPSGVAWYPHLRGLYWLTANLAGLRPLVILVDDTHWADAPSLRWISYLIARIDDLPAFLMLAARDVEPDAANADLLQAIVSAPTVRTIRVEPLTEAGATTMVRTTLGAHAGDEFCAACLSATGGNPLYLKELIDELARAGVEPEDGNSGVVSDVGPRSVSQRVLHRLAEIPAPGIRFAQAVAVLGTTAEPRHLGALLELDEAEISACAANLVHAGILHDGLPMRFAHPIVRKAIYSSLAKAQRAGAHARVARILADHGARPEHVGVHLLEAQPAGDPWVVATLREAAERSLHRGAPAAAARYLRRALEEGPQGSERALVLADLGLAEVRAGVGLAGVEGGEPPAIDHLMEALGRLRESGRRAALALELSTVLTVMNRLDDAVQVLSRELESPDLPDDTMLRLEAQLINVSQMAARTRPLALEWVRRARPELTGSRPGERLLLAQLAHEGVIRGEAADANAALARRALADGALLHDEGPRSPSYCIAAWTLGLCDALGEAEEALGAAIVNGQQTGSPFGFALASCFRSNVRYRQGHLAEAAADANTALDATEHRGHPLAVAFLADALVEQGQLSEAERALAEAGMLGDLPEIMSFQPPLYSRGELRIAQGRLQEGVYDLLEAGRRAEVAGRATPAFRAWRSAAALALARLDRADEADSLVAEELELARRFGAPRALGTALRAAGLLSGGEQGVRLLAEAVDVLQGSQSRLELAHALVDLGAAKRRMGQKTEARTHLRPGLEIAHGCGAGPLAERAATELRAAGARPRSPLRTGVEALTPSERRVAQMAAQGLTNREIAMALFVTPKTVEWHLAQTFRKLDLSSRRQLAGVFSHTTDDAAAAHVSAIATP
jgi:DNA-binding CsgD family transcriptional regulator/tetratricopeptide (TPR) repeat protein